MSSQESPFGTALATLAELGLTVPKVIPVDPDSSQVVPAEVVHPQLSVEMDHSRAQSVMNPWRILNIPIF